MTYPTDARIEAAIRAYVIEKYGTWGYDYWEDAIAEMPRAPIRAAILAADRAAWVTDGSFPENDDQVLCALVVGSYKVFRWNGLHWVDANGSRLRPTAVIAWRKIIGPETLP